MPSAQPSPTGDFAEALSHALSESPLTLIKLQAALAERGHRISPATLSYWQTGRSRPTRAGSVATVTSIEEVLGLPPRSLTDVLHANGDPTWSPTTALPLSDEADRVLEQMGLSWTQPWTGMITYDMVHTGSPDGTERQNVRQMMRADADGITRIPAMFHVTGPSWPELVVGDGVLLGEVVPLEGSSAIVVELLLPRALSAGDYHWLEYEVSWDRDEAEEDEGSHGRSIKAGSNTLVLGATFEGPHPLRARLCHQTPHGDVETELAQWSGDVPAQVQHGLRHAPAGIYWLEWQYTAREWATH